MKHAQVIILAVDEQEVLARVIGIMMRRALKIETLCWEAGSPEGLRYIDATVSGERSRVQRIPAQLEKIVGVLSVKIDGKFSASKKEEESDA